ncbi:MAG: YhbY family RNA-binding protein [Firmicutes bacterium]|nr:YhbY family RNA-binding protein [Bacillota bacterium]
MLTGKQRAYLRGLAAQLQPAVYIGKENLTASVVTEMHDYLNAHELLKVKIQEGSDLQTKDAANEAAQRLGAEFVQAIGRRFVLYRKAQDPEKRSIVLPK